MILVGNARGGAKDLAQHLLNAKDNERVEVHQLYGFVSETLTGALNEAYALSRGTKCKQFLFSLSLNPPADAHISPDDFERAVDQAGEKLGLQNQPRAIVFHEKLGRDGVLRRHCHAVWSRIDALEMKAVHLSFHKRKLQDVSRELYLEHGWDMPRGHLCPTQRDPLNFTLEEWQQAKRSGQDPKITKALIQSCWKQSDSRLSFAAALEQHGYILAKGDRRGFVAVDHQGEIYAIARSVGIKARDVKARLADPENLPSTHEAHAQAAQIITERLEALRKEEDLKKQRELARLETERLRKEREQQIQADNLKAAQQERAERERLERNARLRTGLWGLLDRITGKRSRTLKQNQTEETEALKRDHTEKQTLKTQHTAQSKKIEQRSVAASKVRDANRQELASDIESFNRQAEEARAKRKAEFLERRKTPRRSRTRNRSRDGPDFEM